jgi:hypothetical protein
MVSSLLAYKILEKVIEKDKRFEHMMALALNPITGYRDGIIRCIRSREGDVARYGYIDRSELYKVKGNSLAHFIIGDSLRIQKTEEIVQKIGQNLDFLGLEDPDIWIDEETNLLHLYFTLPFRDDKQDQVFIHLGHAVGPSLDLLEMTEPALVTDKQGNGAKEVSIAPKNKNGFRYNLIESSVQEKDFQYSTIKIAIAKDMGKPWEYGNTVFHPAKHHLAWIGGHASPGPLFSKEFIDVGEGKLLGVLNGREANQRVGKIIKYGIFSVGLFIYDYENGKIDWVSPQSFIQDPQARTITFASQFVETEPGIGILYAHIDDSFVRAYKLSADLIKPLLP